MFILIAGVVAIVIVLFVELGMYLGGYPHDSYDERQLRFVERSRKYEGNVLGYGLCLGIILYGFVPDAMPSPVLYMSCLLLAGVSVRELYVVFHDSYYGTEPHQRGRFAFIAALGALGIAIEAARWALGLGPASDYLLGDSSSYYYIASSLACLAIGVVGLVRLHLGRLVDVADGDDAS